MLNKDIMVPTFTHILNKDIMVNFGGIEIVLEVQGEGLQTLLRYPLFPKPVFA